MLHNKPMKAVYIKKNTFGKLIYSVVWHATLQSRI